ncbi:uncharacterized protein STEHIDRAFT_132393 [Stereum hirsutum FP-91666 SS1]|uniref:uncharacterized protein n=1 Tax=Stereum hirsutum (strain FP-91666) TaxID=721885 RepID=UPI0004449993|nr:uncharacterized protein STEHIDRAFT_132393 [Stereum hirsutum FP-91666 SS1]EIM84859.1 hypothetical protein STEHIDRAFT_132393 [Stereum hirsutum FP-91666 SS1]
MPNGETTDVFCPQWTGSCTSVVGATGTASAQCDTGANSGTARVSCLSTYGDNVADYTDANKQRMGIEYA